MLKNGKEIVIVGGGTAGWLTALTAQHYMPYSNVTLIESEEIGILGAGEGSTPQLVELFKILNIPLSEVVNLTGATIKNGIKFTGWNGPDELLDPINKNYYYHNFGGLDNQITMEKLDYKNTFNKYPLTFFQALYHKISGFEFDVSSILNERNKTPFIYTGLGSSFDDPITPYTGIASYGIHFDASHLALFLKNKGVDRGIKHIEGKVVDFKTDTDNDITAVILEDGSKIDVDFIFDCSGFKRLIIGNFYKAPWKSYSSDLPVNRALPFFLPQEDPNNIPTYTESIAMKYGWMWKIPLQHRYGCGYVFDSNLVSEEDARKEIEDYLGFEPQYPREDKGSFKFDAGYYETPWVNNCISVGLSSGFIEPLEATSIWQSITVLQEALHDRYRLLKRTPEIINKFNRKMCKWNSDISDFIYMHYMGNKSDTEFWTRFKDPNKVPEKVSTFLKNWLEAPVAYDEFFGTAGYLSWVIVAWFSGLIDSSIITEFMDTNNHSFINANYFMDMRYKQREKARMCLTHRYFIDEMNRQNYDKL